MAANSLSPFATRNFGRMNGISSRSLGKPSAIFPGAVASDSDLMIAVDRQQTVLAAPLDSVSTSMTVQNAASIVAYNLLSIDAEIVKVTGPPSGTTVPISRGFDGTTPAVHMASAVVSGFIDAYHHNRVVAEIEAIEQALGPSLSHVPGGVFLNAAQYVFTPQSPGGSLTVGANVINLLPVPVGINGSNANHYVYISGGTGTAEAAKIIGGTAVSGAASGTLIIQCANTHSGAWTIQTATAGIQEGSFAMRGAHLVMPPGDYAIYAPITPPAATWIEGWGSGSQSTLTQNSVQLRFIPVTGNLFNLINDACVVKHLFLEQPGQTTAQAGCTGVYASAGGVTVEDVGARYFYNGFVFSGNSNLVARDITASNSLGDGVQFLNTGGVAINVLSQINAGNGITVQHPTPGQPAISPLLTQMLTFNNQGWGIYFNVASVQLENGTFQADRAGGMYIAGQGDGTQQVSLVNFYSVGKPSVSFTVNPTAPGIRIQSSSVGAILNNVTVAFSQGNGVEVLAPDCQLASIYAYSCGQGLQAANQYALVVRGANASITDFTVGSGLVLIDAGSTVLTSSFVRSSGGGVPAIEFTANALDLLFDANFVFASPGQTALQFDAGCSAVQGYNKIYGTVTGQPAISPQWYQILPIVPVRVPVSLTNTAGTIAPTQAVHYVPAGLIKTITVPSGLTAGQVTLIGTGTWSTDQTGNIGSPAMPSNGQYIPFIAVYDSSTAKWFIK